MNPPKKKSDGDEKLAEELLKAQEELAKLKDLAGRAQADLQNAKDRLQREGADMRRYALEGAFLSLLPTIDNLQRAFKHLPEEISSHDWVKGIQATESELIRQLQALGLKKIDAVGQPVDPSKHEILQAGPGEEGKVTQVLEEGYELNGRIIRPAKVMVGNGEK